MSRPTKLDDLIEKRICDALSRGHSWAAAARAGGIDERTLHRWRAEGREDDAEPRIRQFCQRVEAADYVAESRAIEVLTSKFDSPDERVALTAAQWWLERRRPADWGSKKADVAEPLTIDEAERLVKEAAELAKQTA
jgi:transposase-like protein